MAATLEEHSALDRSLTNQPPSGAGIIARFEELRINAKGLGHAILDICPECPERTLAIRRLEECLMWAVKSIALNQDELVGTDDTDG